MICTIKFNLNIKKIVMNVKKISIYIKKQMKTKIFGKRLKDNRM